MQDRAANSVAPSPRLHPKSGLPDFGILKQPKSDISDFGREGGGEGLTASILVFAPHPTLSP